MNKILGVIGMVVVIVAIAFCAMAFLPKETVSKVNDWGNEKIKQIQNKGNSENVDEEENSENIIEEIISNSLQQNEVLSMVLGGEND